MVIRLRFGELIVAQHLDRDRKKPWVMQPQGELRSPGFCVTKKIRLPEPEKIEHGRGSMINATL